MTIYTVHAPPTKGEDTSPEPDRFVFVRDGFYFWAFVFGPVWLLAKRQWFALLFYVLVVAALQVGLWLMKVPPVTHTLVSLFMHFLVGLEAATVQRWTLNRRRWTQSGIVSGANEEAAERRFFDVWVLQQKKWPTGPVAPSPPPPPRTPPASTDINIIGLFPEPQSRQ